MEGLPEDRARIEEIDAELLHLLNRRARIVAGLHARKTEAGRPIYDAARTDAILDRLVRLNEGPLREEQVRELFTFLLQHFALEHRPPPPAVAGIGVPGPPLLVGAPEPAAPLPSAAARLRRHGIGFLRVDAARAAEAREVCTAHGLELVVAVATEAEARKAATVADIVEAPPAVAARGGCGPAVLLAPGTPADAEAARAAGATTVLVRGPAGGDDRWIAPLGGAALALADVRPLGNDPHGRRAALLGALAAGAHGALLAIGADEDDEELADLAYRAGRLCLALRAWPGATGDPA